MAFSHKIEQLNVLNLAYVCLSCLEVILAQYAERLEQYMQLIQIPSLHCGDAIKNNKNQTPSQPTNLKCIANLVAIYD